MRKALEFITSSPVRSLFVAAFGVTLAATGVAAATIVGCDRPGGEAVPLDGTATTGGICIGACFADPGSGPVDCTPQSTVDTLVIESFDNFENTGLTSYPNAAQDWYSYTDGTSSVFFENYVGGLNDAGYEPAVTPPPAAITPCNANSGPDPGVLHAFGGPFLGWGGGMGITMAKVNGRDPENSNVGTTSAPYYINTDQTPNSDPNAPKSVCCVSRDSAGNCVVTSNPKYAAVCPPANAEFAVAIATLDVSAYDGVSFWARRGPNGQTGIRVNVGDKYTDDDLNYLAQRQQATNGLPQPIYCNRNRECDCLNHQACELISGAALQAAGNTIPLPSNGFSPDTLVSFCGVPTGLDLASGCGAGFGLECVGLNGGPSFCCEQTNCDQPYPGYPCDKLPLAGPFSSDNYANGDIQYYGKTCTPYAFANGISGSYCFDPANDPPPSPPTELCGDFWMTTVDLNTTWQFYRVPFSTLHQQGFAKKSEHLDLHSVSVVRFTWDIGWIDYWVDDLAFYRQN